MVARHNTWTLSATPLSRADSFMSAVSVYSRSTGPSPGRRSTAASSATMSVCVAYEPVHTGKTHFTFGSEGEVTLRIRFIISVVMLLVLACFGRYKPLFGTKSVFLREKKCSLQI